MICNDCADKKHKKCKKRNKNKQGADCDCQHKVPRKAGVSVVKRT